MKNFQSGVTEETGTNFQSGVIEEKSNVGKFILNIVEPEVLIKVK